MQENEQRATEDGIAECHSGPDFFRMLCWVASVIAVATLALIIYEIVSQAFPAIRHFGLKFLGGLTWSPNGDMFGVLPFLVGTATSSLIALIFAFPLGLS